MLCMSQTLTSPQQHAAVPLFTIGDRLRKARQYADIGSAEMAGRIGRTRNSITRYESAETVDDIDELVLRAYAMETGVSFRWLKTGQAPIGGDPVIANTTLG